MNVYEKGMDEEIQIPEGSKRVHLFDLTFVLFIHNRGVPLVVNFFGVKICLFFFRGGLGQMMEFFSV
jgi:hypothetical protein